MNIDTDINIDMNVIIEIDYEYVSHSNDSA